ncbi:MAG: leucine-rich repeat domain-containing protein, partial [Treponema sp.]|nr:leucine-rich repeat domain-containing protein [Treponema sp.]
MNFSRKVLLAVLLSFAAIWLGAETSSDGIWQYRLDEKGNITITGITNTETERLVIPSTVDGKKVTGIADHSFFRYDAAKELIIPDTVTSIGVSAFESCTEIKKISLSKNLTLIPDRCFSDCESLEEIVIPENVRIIGYMGFAECESLKKAVISPNLRLIFDYAFAGCPDLDIHIPRPVEVAEDVFYSHDLEKKPKLHVFKGSMAEIIAKEYNYDFDYEPEGSEGDVPEWSDYEDYLGVIESIPHMVGDNISQEQYQYILKRISADLKAVDSTPTETVKRTSDGLLAWYSDGEFTQIADITGDTPFVLSVLSDDDENHILITYAGVNEYAKDYVMLYMYPDLYESYEEYYDSYVYDLYYIFSSWYSGPKPGYDDVVINGKEYRLGFINLLSPDFEV